MNGRHGRDIYAIGMTGKSCHTRLGHRIIHNTDSIGGSSTMTGFCGAGGSRPDRRDKTEQKKGEAQPISFEQQPAC